MRTTRKMSLGVAFGAALALVAGCSGGSSGDSSNAQGSGSGTGPITYVQGKDNSNIVRPAIDKWNSMHPDQKVTFKEQSDQADQQHDDLVQHFQAKDANYDVVSVDNIWTSEFAAKGWLQPLEGKYKLDTSPLLPATVKAARYNGHLYVAPSSSDGGLLYYRKDLVPTPPKTWDEMMGDCSVAKQNGIDCYAGQYAKYEGLTVNVAEAINTAGGTIVDAKGNPTVDSADAKKGLQRLVTAVQDGNIPKQALTYQEEQGRQSFEAGKLLFLRNWPYVYKLASTDGSSVVKDKFGIAPLPGDSADKPGASSLGGHAIGMSVYSKHKTTALNFMKYIESTDNQKAWLINGSAAPVLSSLYSEADLVQQFPYLPTLLTSIQNAVPRPVTPFYPAVTKAIEDNSTDALAGSKTVDKAMSDISASIKAASSN